MKLLLLCFSVMFVLVCGQDKWELRKTWEDENVNHFETTDFTSDGDDKTEEKRFIWHLLKPAPKPAPKSSECQMGTSTKTCWPQTCGSQAYSVSFPNNYPKIPSVMVSLAGIDADQHTNLRVVLSATRITTTSFDIDFKTWDDTKIYKLKFAWIACI